MKTLLSVKNGPIYFSVIPFLVFFVSMVYTLVEHRDATTYDVGGVKIRNGSRRDDGGK